jgi:hypothetical protein
MSFPESVDATTAGSLAFIVSLRGLCNTLHFNSDPVLSFSEFELFSTAIEKDCRHTESETSQGCDNEKDIGIKKENAIHWKEKSTQP